MRPAWLACMYRQTGKYLYPVDALGAWPNYGATASAWRSTTLTSDGPDIRLLRAGNLGHPVYAVYFDAAPGGQGGRQDPPTSAERPARRSRAILGRLFCFRAGCPFHCGSSWAAPKWPA